MLRRELGPCDMGEEGSIHISKDWLPLLSANAAYDLLTFITDGQTQSFVYGRRDSKLPFLKLWGFLLVFCPKLCPCKRFHRKWIYSLGKAYKKPHPFHKELLLFGNQLVMEIVSFKNI
jgi:hypothetical protein